MPTGQQPDSDQIPMEEFPVYAPADDSQSVISTEGSTTKQLL